MLWTDTRLKAVCPLEHADSERCVQARALRTRLLVDEGPHVALTQIMKRQTFQIENWPKCQPSDANVHLRRADL
jgi:hypothetical protein